MNRRVSDLTTDENLGGGDPPESPQTSKTTATRIKWKGCEFWPLSAGSEFLFTQIVDPRDSNLTIVFLFLFLLLYRGGANARDDFVKVVPLAWDKLKLRGALLEWLDSLGSLTMDDKMAALKVFDQAHGWKAKSVISTGRRSKGKQPGRRTRSS